MHSLVDFPRGLPFWGFCWHRCLIPPLILHTVVEMENIISSKLIEVGDSPFLFTNRESGVEVQTSHAFVCSVSERFNAVSGFHWSTIMVQKRSTNKKPSLATSTICIQNYHTKSWSQDTLDAPTPSAPQVCFKQNFDECENNDDYRPR